jgi:hypothetical protein
MVSPVLVGVVSLANLNDAVANTNNTAVSVNTN